jgi:hypothetical protein
MNFRVLCGGALVLGLASTASAQMTPIFRMNCGATGANYPLCGFSANVGENTRGTYWQRTWVNGAGPSDEGVVQISHIATSAVAEYYAGWRWDNAPQVAQGSTRYIRYRIKLISPVALPAAQPGKEGWGGKFVIFGDGADWANPPERTRFISNLRHVPGGTTQYLLRSEMNIDGPPSRWDYPNLTPDVWHSVQMKIRSSTTTSSANGRLFMYLDGNNSSESTPTVQSSGDVQINTDGWNGALGFGYYFLTLGPGGRAVYQVTGFEYDDQFDPNWHTGGGTTPPPPTAPTAPTNVRIITADAGLLLGASVLATLVAARLRRRRTTEPE